jgi:predicted enzyme related to lactoylglutathione lyase
MIKKVAFTMYPVVDIDRARNFYETILGLKPGSISAKGGWVEYDLPQGGCFAITTFAQTTPSAVAGGTLAFEVDNLDEMISNLKSRQVEIKADNIISPVCKMAVILDSEGNSILLHQLNNPH